MGNIFRAPPHPIRSIVQIENSVTTLSPRKSGLRGVIGGIA